MGWLCTQLNGAFHARHGTWRVEGLTGAQGVGPLRAGLCIL